MEKYEIPVMEVIHFEAEDVITLSDGGTGSGGSIDWGALNGGN